MKKYNVSIVMPYYKKINELKFAMQYNYKELEKVNEVILLIDEYLDNLDQFSFLMNYNINFKFFMNSENHSWRNPSVVLNRGIKESTSEKIIILSPETIILENSLQYLIENCDESSFSIGMILFITYDTFRTSFNKDLFNNKVVRTPNLIGPVSFGSICCTKSNFEKVNYYSEEFFEWGGEDDDIRSRLMKNNINKKTIKIAQFIHLETTEELQQRYDRFYNLERKPNNNINLYNNFNQVIIKKFDTESYLNNIPNLDKYVLNKNLKFEYPIILLTQCYNEEKNISDYLKNVSLLADGIIVLDDGSDDNTWELLDSEKIILKLKVKRNDFNDLRNRNLLLNLFENLLINNNIDVKWFLWLDLDERITNNIDFINKIKKEILLDTFVGDVISLPLFHMWNETDYNSEYPYSENGLQYKKRLIRNNIIKLPYILKSNLKLHFFLNPYKGIEVNSLLQIKHLSYIDKESRIRKFNLYTKNYDVEKIQKSYNHFLNDDVKLLPYDDFMVYNKSIV